MLLNSTVCDEVTTVNVEDGVVKAIEETDVTTVGEPGLRAVEESGKNCHGLVDPDPCLVLQACVIPNAFVQPTK